jgi:hypothetical protein
MAFGGWGGTWGSTPNIYGRNAGGFDVNRYFGTPDTNSELFWQSKEGMPFAYSRAVNTEADPNSYYNRWLNSQEGRVNTDYVNASLQNPDLQYYQYVGNQMRNLANRYTQLPSWQQGQNAPAWFAGRRL